MTKNISLHSQLDSSFDLEAVLKKAKEDDNNGMSPKTVTITTVVTTTLVGCAKEKAVTAITTKVVTAVGGQAAITSLGAKVTAAAASFCTLPVAAGVVGGIVIGGGLYYLYSKRRDGTTDLNIFHLSPA